MDNSSPLSPEQIEKLAIKRAKAKFGWYIHAAIFVAINLFLLLRFAFGLGHYGWHRDPHPFPTLWLPFPTLLWGLGLALHGISVFLLGPGSPVRERLVQKERERLRRLHGTGTGTDEGDDKGF